MLKPGPISEMFNFAAEGKFSVETYVQKVRQLGWEWVPMARCGPTNPERPADIFFFRIENYAGTGLLLRPPYADELTEFLREMGGTQAVLLELTEQAIEAAKHANDTAENWKKQAEESLAQAAKWQTVAERAMAPLETRNTRTH
jgi:hypothetical protein